MQRVTIQAVKGNTTVVTQGLSSSNVVEGSFPSCTVSVFDTGTSNLTPIFGDNLSPPTPKSNPFTADSNGFGFFYAANGKRVDVQLSGTGITAPFIVAGDILLDDPSLLAVSAPSTVAFSATPTFDLSQHSWFEMTLTGNVTGPSFTNPVSGSILIMSLTQDGAGAHTFAWPGTFLHPPTIAAGANAVTELIFGWDGTNWRQLAATGDSLAVPGAATFASTATVAGNFAAQAATTLKNMQGLAIVFADQYTDVQTAMNALPASGGLVDARSPNVNLALGTLDPGADTKAVTLLLGPLAYTADHIVMRANFRIIGSAPTNVSSSATRITSVGLNTQPLIVNITSGLIAVYGAGIENVTLIGLAGNTTQKGLFFDVSANTTLSVIDHFRLSRVAFSGFKGVNMHCKGSINVGALACFVQFVKMEHVTVTRPASGSDGLRCEGAVGQFDYYSCQIDGNAKGDGNNIYIGGTSNADVTFPYSHNFYGLTSQNAATAFTGDGFFSVNFYGAHHENLNGVYLLQSSFTNSRCNQATFTGGYFANAGINAGNGYILKSTTTNAFGIALEKSCLASTPDKLVIGTNLNTITVRDNTMAANIATANVTTGIDAQMNPAATMNLGGYHTVMLQASATQMTTIVSQLGPGERITFFANGICSFATGGNITLVGGSGVLTLQAGENATFENSDYSGTNVWRLIATSTATLNGATVVALTAQGANIGTTTAFTVPATPAKGYRVQVYAAETRAGTVSSTMVSVVIGWTDPDSNTAVTFTIAPGTAAGNVINNPAATDVFGTFLLKCKASTTITYQTTGYASAGATSMQYALLITVEPIGS